MNHRKSFTSLIISASMLSGLLFTSATNVNAAKAKWHSGTPKVLHGSWAAKKTNGGSDGKTTISNQKINETHRFAPINPETITKLKYKKTGKQKYTIKGANMSYASSGIISKYKFKVKVHNHNQIYFSGIRTGKFGDAAIYHRK
ncbi:hypothetical protein MOO44_08445 [Nicoliella spurrieriana]|uniref:Uncharacterized protein n=1 Tax=Nicoliella spurrieriana TaxID=2925830 RepID=A0A976X5B5_9LACO|nr:hypothetical protein [Nicoliella spurrieriana]UQS86878.1 hypothetical protein MOO44_08445 [Nicoliella spurrieriana]